MTGIELFKTQALKGLSTYMADWPKIIATESITEELSRLLLPLAWRVRVEDTPAHRAELRECWEALKRNWTCTPQPGSAHFASQARRISDSATTVRAGAGVPTCTMSPYGQMCAPCTTNQCYGNGERSVCQETGDPASDVLCRNANTPLTCELLAIAARARQASLELTNPRGGAATDESNYLLLNLQEAFAATGEPDYRQVSRRTIVGFWSASPPKIPTMILRAHRPRTSSPATSRGSRQPASYTRSTR